MSFRKTPTLRTVRKKAKGMRAGLGITPGGGIKSKENRAKTHAGGKARVRTTGPQTKARKL